MNAPLLSLASGVLPEFSPAETTTAAVATGWDAVGVWVDPATWTAATSREVRDRAADAGMGVLDVEVIWIKPGPLDPDHKRIIDAGAAVGARNVLAVSSDPEEGATADKLAALCDHAAGLGLRVSLEFGAFTEVRDLAAALRVLRRTSRAEAGLLVDPLHLARTGGTPEDLRGVDPSRFAYAQFCDAAASGPSPDDRAAIIDEAIDGRLAPGQGALPLAALLAALPSETPLSVEVRSKLQREAWPDPADRARALLAGARAWLAGVAPTDTRPSPRSRSEGRACARPRSGARKRR